LTSFTTAPAPDDSPLAPGTEPAAFRRLLGNFATGVTVVTFKSAAGSDMGVTVSAFASVSLQPPLVLVCLQQSTAVHSALCSVTYFAVNVLAADQEALARRFAARCPERFEGVSISRGQTGAALIDDALAHIECRIAAMHQAGDHSVFLGEVVAGRARTGEPLLHFSGQFSKRESAGFSAAEDSLRAGQREVSRPVPGSAFNNSPGSAPADISPR
jgi:flavin reductase (DIM6/NTAB) family NADH-FMN oxidoreductase RutF